MKITIDILSLISIFLIVVGVIILIGYYIISQVDSCTKNPLDYYVYKIKETTNADGVVGVISIIKKGNAVGIIHFGNFSFYETPETSFTKNNYTIPKI